MSLRTAFALLALALSFSLTDPSVGRAESRTSARPLVSTPAELSYYGPGFLGQRTSCGKTLRPGSLWVAALKPHLAQCGAKLTLYYRGKRYHVRVEDRGAWRADSRALDAAPGLRRRMGFHSLAQIRYTRGWAPA